MQLKRLLMNDCFKFVPPNAKKFIKRVMSYFALLNFTGLTAVILLMKSLFGLQRGRVVKSAVVMINIVLVQNLLGLFCCVLGTLYRTFPCFVILASSSKYHLYLYKTKKQIKNLNRTSIFWHPLKQVGSIAFPMYSIAPPSLSCELEG